MDALLAERGTKSVDEDCWHVVCHPDCSEPHPLARVWTLTLDKNIPGWDTNGGYHGYGLTHSQAQELADAANFARDLVEVNE